LYGGLKETNEKEISVSTATALYSATSFNTFKEVIKFIYTGRMTFPKSPEILEILGLAHVYGLTRLQTSITGCISASLLTLDNVFQFYNVSQLFMLDSLKKHCIDIIDRNPVNFLQHSNFPIIASECVKDIIVRDEFPIEEEIQIFYAVKAWLVANPNASEKDKDEILGAVRFSLISRNELIKTVRPTKLVNSDVIIEAIEAQDECKRRPRYGTNIVKSSYGAKLITGICLTGKDSFFNGNKEECAFTTIGDKKGITVELEGISVINHIRLYIRKDIKCSYNIWVSTDMKNWTEIADYTDDVYSGWMDHYFLTSNVKFIRITGTKSTGDSLFYISIIEASFRI